MTTAYPGSPPGSGSDTFGVPTEPDDTPLSESGGSPGGRDHPQLHADEGAAIQALEGWAALRTHDHSGDTTSVAKGGRLIQANTHGSADTDLGPTSIHHTLDLTRTNPNQAASATHVHDYSEITNTPFRICTSITRPSSPFTGMTIFETDTNFMRIYCSFGGTLGWHIAPVMAVPVCVVQQSAIQYLPQGGTPVVWQQVLEDNDNFFSPGTDAVNFTIHDGGLYNVACALQWGSEFAPDVSNLVMYVNGQQTGVGEWQFLRGNGFTPGFSQTLSFNSPYRFNDGDVMSIFVDYQAGSDLSDRIATFILQLEGYSLNPYAAITSRLSINYLSP